MWSPDPAVLIPRYHELGRNAKTLPFFLIFTTAWPAACAAAALLTARRAPWTERRYIAIFAAGAWAITAVLVLWMAPAIWSVIRGAVSGEDAVLVFRRWERANLVRLGAELLLLPVAIRALIGAYGFARVPPGR